MKSAPLLLMHPTAGLRLRAWFDRQSPVTAVRRWRRPREADFWVLSYPKTGRTWFRVMVARLMAEHYGRPELARGEVGDEDLHFPGVPSVAAKHDGRPQVKTATEIGPDKSEFAGVRVILLARDLRDTLVSNYFQVTRRVNRFDGDIATYLRWPRGSFEGMLRYYNVWAAQRHVPRDFMLVRYEDLHADPARELRRVAAFMGMDGVSDSSIEAAVRHGSFDTMRQLEATRPADGSSRAAGRAGDPESFKSRRGKVGGYRDYLAPPDVAWINARIAGELDPFYGYGIDDVPGPVGDTARAR